MYILLVVITLIHGPPVLRTSMVQGNLAPQECFTNLPLMMNLYEKGSFEDGPPTDNIKKVTGTCIPAPLYSN